MIQIAVFFAVLGILCRFGMFLIDDDAPHPSGPYAEAGFMACIFGMATSFAISLACVIVSVFL